MKKGDEKEISKGDEPSENTRHCKRTPKLTRSKRFESLINFLDQESGVATAEVNNDNQRGGRSGSIDSRGSLLDITNNELQSSQTSERISSKNKEKLKNPTDRVNELIIARSSKNKKYIWDEWDEKIECYGVDADNDVQDDETRDSQIAGDIQAEKISAARLQLIQLKAAGDEIQARAAKLKTNQETLKADIDRLHSIRIENEANHVKSMKMLKREFTNRKAKTEAETKKITEEQKRVHDELTTANQKLEKKECSLMAALERVAENKRQICERMESEGIAEMQVMKKSWLHAEETDIKSKERKLASKLKRDAANAIEPKLRQLVEMNTEELSRLQKQATRELDSYKLTLFSKMNREYKIEADRIRDIERQRSEQLEGDWMEKLNALRAKHSDEMRKKAKEHEQRMQIIKQHFEIDKQHLIHEYKVAQEDSQNYLQHQMEQASRKHERDLAAMEKDHHDNIMIRQQQNKLEFEQWRSDRENELQQLEANELKQAENEMKQKMKADLDLVSKKLNEETREKRVQMSSERNEKITIVKANQQKELASAYLQLAQAESAVSALTIQEEEARSNLEDTRREISKITTLTYDKEDALAIQEIAMKAFATEKDQVSLDKNREEERKIALETSKLCSLEKELDHLISTHPQHLEAHQKEIKSLKCHCDQEMKLAQDKVADMLEKKSIEIEDALAKLASLQKDISEIERRMDEARSRQILGIQEVD